MCKIAGATTIAVLRRPGREQMALDNGADHVFATSETESGDLDKIRELTGGELAHALLDCVGGRVASRLLNAVKDGGRVVFYGNQSGDSVAMNPLEVASRQLSICGLCLPKWLVGRNTYQILRYLLALSV